MNFEDRANLEMDILEATLLASKDFVLPFLEKILSLDLATVFYGAHDHPEISFEFTKWVGPIKAITDVTLDP